MAVLPAFTVTGIYHWLYRSSWCATAPLLDGHSLPARYDSVGALLPLLGAAAYSTSYRNVASATLCTQWRARLYLWHLREISGRLCGGHAHQRVLCLCAQCHTRQPMRGVATPPELLVVERWNTDSSFHGTLAF